jgi:hypothetical protein
MASLDKGERIIRLGAFELDVQLLPARARCGVRFAF